MTIPRQERDESDATLRVVVADDEPLSRRAVRFFLERMGGAMVVAECETGVEALAAIREHEPDLAVLDVQMPEMDGFEVVEQLDDPPAIIFLTAFDQYAVRAFSVRAVDYVLKPLDEHRFLEAVDRAREWTVYRANVQKPSPYLTHLRSRQGRRVNVISVAEIEWVEAADYYARVHTHAGRTFLVRMSLSNLALRLDPAEFVRVHRSAIVSVDAVRETRAGDAEISLRSGARIATSRDGRNRLQQVFRTPALRAAR